MEKKIFRKTLLFFIVLSLSVFILAGSGHAQSQIRPEYLPDEILVKFKDDVTENLINSTLMQVKGTLVKKFRLVPVLHIKVPANTVHQAVNFLKGLSEVEYAEPNYLRYPNAVPNDTRFTEMWGLNNTGQTGGTIDADIDAVEAWDLSTGSSNIIVADIDSGIDRNHEDLIDNLWTNLNEIPNNGIDDDGNGYIDDINGWDFARDDNDPNEESVCGGHGTHTAGTIGARGNNGIGVTGVNWNVKIMPLKIFKTYFVIFCSASSSDIISAIDYAAMMGVRVSNNSYGGGPNSQAEYDAIRASKSIFVAAAGNGGTDGIGDNNDLTPEYPASYDLNNIIAVAATDHNDIRASFSNYGTTSVDLAAPGVSVLSTTPNDTYSLFSGTSMATPHVTGSVALLMAYDTGLTNNEIKWRILNGTDNKGLPVLTGGRLNINNSLTLPPPLVTINVSPIGPTTVSPGETISYNIALSNNDITSKTVNVSVVAVYPDGTEVTLASRSVTLGGNSSANQSFTKGVPAGIAPGEYQIAGRVEIPSVSYDEDIVIYTIVIPQ